MKVPSSNGEEEDLQGRQAVLLVEKTAKDLGRITKGRLTRWTPKDRSHEKLLTEAKGE